MRRLLWALTALLLLWGVAWLAVPPLVRSQLQRHASEALGRQVTVDKVEFSPWSLELTLHGLRIATQDGAGTQLEIARIYADAELQSLWRLGPVVDAIAVDRPVLHLAQTASGVLDIDDVLQRLAASPAPEPPSKPLRFALYNLQLQGGLVDFDDQVVGSKQVLNDLQLRLPFISNLKADREVKVTPHLAFQLNGSPFETTAQSTPFTDDRKTSVHLQIRQFNLADLAGYIPASAPARLKAALLDADLDLDFIQEDDPVVRLTGRVGLEGVKTTDAQGRPQLEIDRLGLELADVQPLRRRVDLAALELSGVRGQLQRAGDGSLSLPTGQGSGAADSPGPAAQADLPDAKADPAADASADWQLHLRDLRLRDGGLTWIDASLPGGSAQWQLSQWQLDASDLRWPLQAQPTQLRTSAAIAGGGVDADRAAQLALQGQVGASQSQAALSLQNLRIEMAAPYLAQWLKPRATGVVDADVGVAFDRGALAVQVARLSVSGMQLDCPGGGACAGRAAATGKPTKAGKSTPDRPVQWQQLLVEGARILPLARSAQVQRVTLARPQLQIARSAAGRWMAEDWVKPQPKAAPQPSAAGKRADAAPPWRVQVQSVQLRQGAAQLRDASMGQPVQLQLAAIDLQAQGVDWNGSALAPVKLQLKTQVEAGRRLKPGQLQVDGQLSMAPQLDARMRIAATRLPLQLLQPYVAEAVNVDVRRADASLHVTLHYAQQRDAARVALQGDAALDAVQVQVADDAAGDAPQSAGQARVGARGEDLLRWKTLALQGVDLKLQPGRPLSLDVRQTTLSDFFARIIVHEDGRINLQDIRKAQEGAEGGAAAAQPAAADAGPAPMLRFGPVALNRGEVHFSDHFIRPNYSANLSELQGQLSAFSSQPAQDGSVQMAQLQLQGLAQGSASLRIEGQLNPLATPLALDIQGHMRDLDLPPLSPYSIKYAGHGIERGKLSMDVAYKIEPDGQLTASNKLVLNQLSFGDPVEGAPASLPVRLATALLADRNGVIDVDLPISGSLNDPEFRLGAVILKVIGNLIMKAVTAPFSLLTGLLGSSGDEQGVIHFTPGSAQLDAAAHQQLDKVAQALVERPAVKATITGWSDSQAEADGYRQARLQSMLLAYKRRQAQRAGQDPDAVTTVTAEEYPELLHQVYKRTDGIGKQRNLIGMVKDVPEEQMQALLLQSIAVPEDAMRQLALERAEAVRDYLAAQKVPAQQLFIGAAKSHDAQADKAQGEGWKPQADLALSAR